MLLYYTYDTLLVFVKTLMLPKSDLDPVLRVIEAHLNLDLDLFTYSFNENV